MFWGCLEQAQRPGAWQGHPMSLAKTLWYFPCCFCPVQQPLRCGGMHLCAYLCVHICVQEGEESLTLPAPEKTDVKGWCARRLKLPARQGLWSLTVPCRCRKSGLSLYLCEKQAMRGWFWKNSQDRRPSGLCGRKLGAEGGGSLSEVLPKARGHILPAISCVALRQWYALSELWFPCVLRGALQGGPA